MDPNNLPIDAACMGTRSVRKPRECL